MRGSWRTVRTLLLAAMAALLVLGTTATVLAATHPQEEGHKEGLFGYVESVGDSSIIVVTDEGPAEVQVTEETEIRRHGDGEATVALADIAVGSRVAILARVEGEVTTALKIGLIPGEPQRRHLTVTVLEVSGNVVVAEDSEGNRYVIELDFPIETDLEGQVVTFVAFRGLLSNRFKAKAAEKLERVIERLHQAIQESSDSDEPDKPLRLQHLRERLHANMLHQLEALHRIIEDAPEAARPHLEAALEQIRAGYEAALGALDMSQADIRETLRRREVHGLVSSVDTEESSLTVAIRRGEHHVTRTFSVTNETTIVLNGEPVHLGDLHRGDRVAVVFIFRSGEALRIRATSESGAVGIIQAVNTAESTLTIHLRSGGSLKLTVTEETRIELNGEPATLSDLHRGMAVKVSYNTRTHEALVVAARAEGEVRAIIKSFNADTGELVLVTAGGNVLHLQITHSSRVRVPLLTGTRVRVEFNVATRQVLRIRPNDMPEIQEGGRFIKEAKGTIEEISGDRITLTLEDGSFLTLTVTDETDISRHTGRRTAQLTLNDLQVGYVVQVKYNMETLVVLRIRLKGYTAALAFEQLEPEEEEAESKGFIQHVNTKDRTVTVTLDGDITVILIVTDNTILRLRRNALALTELLEGALVEVKYNPTSLVADKIVVEDELEYEGEGVIQSISGDVVTVALENGRTVDLTITHETRIRHRGAAEALTLDNLVILAQDGRLTVEVKFNPLTREVMRMVVEDEGEEEDGVVVLELANEAEGTMFGVSGDHLTITLADGSSLTVTITGNTHIEIDGQDTSLTDLAEVPQGAEVKLSYNPGTSEALEIEVETYLGKEEEGGGDTGLEVQGEGDANEEPSTEAQQTVAEAEGRIHSVDPNDSPPPSGLVGTVTITLDDGSTLGPLSITEETEIELNGRDVSLADLAAAAQEAPVTVKVSYNPDTLEAIEVDAVSSVAVEEPPVTAGGNEGETEQGSG